MDDVRSALAWSIGARALAAVVGLLALPLYLRYLGIEAYGIVGLFASLQVMAAFLDFGLPTALTGQLAGTPRGHTRLPHARNLTRTFEWAYLGLALLLGLLLVLAAPLVATNWVNRQSLSTSEVTWGLQLAGLSLACGWPTNLYAGGLAGLHRQVPLAVSTAVFAALRVMLVLLFLSNAPTLASFFWAQVLVSTLQSAATRWQLWRELALSGHRPISQWELLARSRRFAGGMTAITVSGILLAQLDKLILSYMVRLADFGLYVIAGSLAAALFILIGPLFSIVYPRLSSAWADGDAAVADLYHISSQLMAALVLPLAAVLVCFPAQALFLLTHNAQLSDQAANVVIFLVLAAACNGIMNMPYALQLSAGWTSLSAWINVGAIMLLAPAMWWAAMRYGAAGGAATWAALNVGYVLFTPHLLHRRLLNAEKWRWYWEDVVLPAAASLAAAWLLRSLLPVETESRWQVALRLASYWLVVVGATLVVLGRLRVLVTKALWR